jgi:hypothetical protein
MFRKSIIGAVLGLTLSVIGCSKSNENITGDINDPLFQESKPQIEAAIALAVGSVDQTIDYSFHAPSDTAAPVTRGLGRPAAVAAVDTFNYSYDTVSGWHVAYAVFSDSGVSGYVRDSVQFRDALAAFQQNYDSTTTDFIWMKQALDVDTDDTSFVQASISALFDLNVSGLQGETVTAGGSASMSFDLVLTGDSGTCSISYDFTHSLAGLQVAVPANEDSGVCPIGGGLDLAGNVTVSCTGDQGNEMFNANWTVHVTFNSDGTMTVAAQTGNTTWTYTGASPCGNYESPI